MAFTFAGHAHIQVNDHLGRPVTQTVLVVRDVNGALATCYSSSSKGTVLTATQIKTDNNAGFDLYADPGEYFVYVPGIPRPFEVPVPSSPNEATFTATTTTVAPSAGAGAALPVTPAGYVTININGTPRKVAYY